MIEALEGLKFDTVSTFYCQRDIGFFDRVVRRDENYVMFVIPYLVN